MRGRGLSGDRGSPRGRTADFSRLIAWPDETAVTTERVTLSPRGRSGAGARRGDGSSGLRGAAAPRERGDQPSGPRLRRRTRSARDRRAGAWPRSSTRRNPYRRCAARPSRTHLGRGHGPSRPTRTRGPHPTSQGAPAAGWSTSTTSPRPGRRRAPMSGRSPRSPHGCATVAAGTSCPWCSIPHRAERRTLHRAATRPLRPGRRPPGSSGPVGRVPFSFTVAFGVLLDTLVVRSLLVPAPLRDIGRRARWPGRLGRGPAPLPRSRSASAREAGRLRPARPHP